MIDLRTTIAPVMIAALFAVTGCGQSASPDGIVYEGNEQAVRQHMEEVTNEEMAHFKATAQDDKPAEQRVQEEERAQRATGT